MTNLRPLKKSKKAIFYGIHYFGLHEGPSSQVILRYSRSDKLTMGLRNTPPKFYENLTHTHEKSMICVGGGGFLGETPPLDLNLP